ncbi:sugar dehydrogenase complex small subunit [Acetobacteraceae bacterium ESL0709]|nr:sugar dehydrogenase complex small subunit [Acetobacteraceae bacterium ESL0697]MDF7677265.1 sugar dehydrogenase complex small subunit [Acetobacteraceae bacterium ESL0709]
MDNYKDVPPSTEKLTRRVILQSSAALAALLVFSPSLLAASSESSEFLQISQFLTCRPNLNPTIAARAYAALAAEDSGFAEKLRHLHDAIQQDNFTDMSQFGDFVTRHPDLQPIAMKIISAWYLGYTGTPSMNILQDDTQFISYEHALMYEPTHDATVIPSFSRGRTNYWVNPPSSLATD